MTKHLSTAVLSFGLAIFWIGPISAAAQQKQSGPPAPIPAQILTAKKVFIANGGGDESRYDAVSYSDGPDRAYNEFYTSMKTWGRYELGSRSGECGPGFRDTADRLSTPA
jgi:hypothetical protein